MVRHIVLWKLKKEMTEEALKNYASHPEHIAVAENKVKPFVSERICYDYEIN
ncbi:MAG: Dabb family protein [Catonella sp.]|uniref:Dabb family protein n=1 Tax=Catonella sp. TaxID=2382125 RepID=UPI003FA093E4